MGLGNFFKRQVGIGRLPDTQLNEVTVAQILKTGAPFVVYLPIWDTERIGGGISLSKSMGGGFRQSVYTPAPSRKVQRSIKTLITYNLNQITIQHAQKNGKHIIINNSKITRVGKGPDGVEIELVDGLIYKFIMDKDIKNRWKQLGFDPQFPIGVFYNFLSGMYVRKYQAEQVEIARNQSLMQERKIQEERLEKQKNNERLKLIKEEERAKKLMEKEEKRLEKERIKEQEHLEKLRLKELKTIEKQKEIERKKLIKEKEKIEKNIQKIRKQNINEFSIKLKKLKEVYDIEAISKDEFDAIKSDFLTELKDIPIPDDINPMAIIKNCKELLDIGAITHEEFYEIKSKFLEKI